MLTITGADRFKFSAMAAKARAEKQVTKQYQSYLRKVFADLVGMTPQWSGNLAANWNIVGKGEQPSVVDWYKKDKTGYTKSEFRPAAIGDGEAVHAALERADDKINSLKWNSKVTFVNPVDYADEIDANPSQLRPANLVMGKEVMVAYIVSKYSRGEVILGKVSL